MDYMENKKLAEFIRHKEIFRIFVPVEQNNNKELW